MFLILSALFAVSPFGTVPTLILLLTLVTVGAIGYFIVWPMIKNHYTRQFYLKQGAVVPSGFSLLTGSSNKMQEYIEDSKTEQVGFAFSQIVQKEYFAKGKKFEPLVLLQFGMNVNLCI